MTTPGSIITADTFNRLLKFLETTSGRDKIARLLQYGSRFFSWYLLNYTKEYSGYSKNFSALETQSSLARKLFRLAKSLQTFQAAWKSFTGENDLVLAATTVIQNIGLGLWLLYDHVIWANKIGFWKNPNIDALVPIYQRRSNIFWLIAMVAGIVKSAYLLQQTQQLANNTSKAETLDSLRKRQFEYLLELFRNIFDVPIPLTALNQQVGKTIPVGIVGLFGSVSSIIGLYQVWVKTR